MEHAILYPMVAQSALIFIVLTLLVYRRLKAIQEKQVDFKYYRIFVGEGEPEHVSKVQRSFLNQFEMPVLFFVGCLVAAVFNLVDSIVVYSAWAYVAVRVVHAIVHVTGNNVMTRFKLFALSNLILLFMWAWMVL